MRALLIPLALLLLMPSASAAQQVPPLPDSSGWGTHVLAVARDPAGGVWVGTYGRGIYRLRPGASRWEHIESDTTETSISWDFVHAFGFGPRGEIWYGTVGNGWGVSADDGKTWKNWTFDQLGPEWQYVAPGGIVTRGDTVWVGTADGVQMTVDHGAHWLALVDATGPAAKGPADQAVVALNNEYVLGMGLAPDGGLEVLTLAGLERPRVQAGGFVQDDRPQPVDGQAMAGGGTGLAPGQCGLNPRPGRRCLDQPGAAESAKPRPPLTTWFRRPIAPARGNHYIDQTYRYGSTMGGNFQQHQGVEFNNPDGTPVHAIGAGTVVYAGRAEAGALTVGILHDTTVAARDTTYRIFSVYYHNSALEVRVGDRVKPGDVISRVGNTGRATNDHLHLEVHAVPMAIPRDSVAVVIDSLNRYPAYTTNPELWIEPLPGTGIVAGQVFDGAGHPVPQARIYGIEKRVPRETPFSFIETYGSRAHSHPLYREHFALGDVPPGQYTLGVEVGGKRVFRSVRIEPGMLTWVEFRP